MPILHDQDSERTNRTQTGRPRVSPSGRNILGEGETPSEDRAIVTGTPDSEGEAFQTIGPLEGEIGRAYPLDPDLDIFPSLGEAVQEFARGTAITMTRFGQGVIDLQTKADRFLELGTGPVSINDLIEAAGADPERMSGELRRTADAMIEESPRSVGGAMIRDFSRIASSYGLLRSALGSPSGTLRGWAMGSAADVAAYGPTEPRLSNVLKELPSPWGPMFGIFATQPGEAEHWARLRQIGEGIWLGGVMEGFGSTARAISSRFGRAARTAIIRRSAREHGGDVPQISSMPNLTGGEHTPGHIQAQSIAYELLGDIPKIAEVGNMSDTDFDLAMREAISRDPVSHLSPHFQALDTPWSSRYAAWVTQEFKSRLTRLLHPPNQLITQEDYDAKVAWFNQMVKSNWRLSDEARQANLAQVEERLATGVASRRRREASPDSIFQAINRDWFDRGDRIQRLLSGSGEAVLTRFRLMQGASSRASMEAVKAWRSVYGGTPVGSARIAQMPIDEDMVADLNMLIALRRDREIFSYRGPEGVEGGYQGLASNFSQADANYLQFKQHGRSNGPEMTAERWAELTRRADQFFNVMKSQTVRLFEEGIISDDELRRLTRLDYAPTEFFDRIDPIVARLPGEGGRAVNVRASGISELGEGADEAFRNLDYEAIMERTIAAVNGRAARNRSNRELFHWANQGNGGDQILTTAPRSRFQRDYVGVHFFENGERKDMWLHRDFAQQWAVDPDMAARIPRWAAHVSGSTTVRPMATGAFNPEFALIAPFRDLGLMWLQKDTYSMIAPRATAQMVRDLIDTAPDAFMRRGAYEDYINEGGGMNFLTHQGRVEGWGNQRIPQGLRTAEDILGYLNSSVELWTRLAYRQRVLRNLAKANGGVLPPDAGEQATLAARNYLDFAQGGIIAKDVDVIVPYFNASLQGLRSAARAAHDSPGQFAFKSMQAITAFASLNLANEAVNPGAQADVPSHVRMSNWIITTPMSFTNASGDTQSGYIRIPIDHTFVWLKGLTDLGMYYTYGRRNTAPSVDELEIIKRSWEAFQVSAGPLADQTGVLPPVVQSAFAMANINPITWEPIWTGPDDIPEEMKYNVFPDERTSPLAQDVGGLLGVSPAKLETGIRQVIPRNIWTDTVGGSYARLVDPLPESMQEEAAAHQLTQIPGVRRFFGVTYPGISSAERGEAIVEQVEGPQFEFKRQLDTEIALMVNGERRPDQVERWLLANTEQDPVLRQRAVRQYEDAIRVQEVFRQIYGRNGDAPVGAPSMRTILGWSRRSPEARARLFADEWERSFNGQEDGRLTRMVLRNILGRAPGFSGESQEFIYYLNEVRNDQVRRGLEGRQLVP